MVISTPSARITVDGRRLTAAEAALVRCTAESSVLGLHDRATVVVSLQSPFAHAAPGALLQVELGPADALETQLTGAIDRVGHFAWGTCLEVRSASAALDRTRLGRAYVQQTVGDIAQDLLGQAGVQAGAVESGPMLAVHHVDERRSAWHHLRQLAGLFAAELSSGGDGSVNVRAPRRGAADVTLRAGAELLGWVAGTQAEGAAPRTVGPFSAASEQGSDAWALVHHEPGGAGDREIVPAIRDQDRATARDESLGAAHRRGQGFAEVTCTGQATLRAGDLVELEGVGDAEGTYRALAVTHRLDSLTGLVSRLRLEGAA